MRMDYNGYTLDSDERHLVSSILDCIDECLVNYPGLECTSVLDEDEYGYIYFTLVFEYNGEIIDSSSSFYLYDNNDEWSGIIDKLNKFTYSDRKWMKNYINDLARKFHIPKCKA